MTFFINKIQDGYLVHRDFSCGEVIEATKTEGEAKTTATKLRIAAQKEAFYAKIFGDRGEQNEAT